MALNEYLDKLNQLQRHWDNLVNTAAIPVDHKTQGCASVQRQMFQSRPNHPRKRLLDSHTEVSGEEWRCSAGSRDHCYLKKLFASRFTLADQEMLPRGRDNRWKNRVELTRYKLVSEGLLKTGSPTGI